MKDLNILNNDKLLMKISNYRQLQKYNLTDKEQALHQINKNIIDEESELAQQELQEDA